MNDVFSIIIFLIKPSSGGFEKKGNLFIFFKEIGGEYKEEVQLE